MTVHMTVFVIVCELVMLVIGIIIGAGWSKEEYDKGTRVWHKKYGAGTIIDVNLEGNFEVEFDRPNPELEHRYNSNYQIARRCCIDFFSPNSIKELSIIKKIAA